MAEWVDEPGWHDQIAAVGRDKQDQVAGAVLGDMRAGVPVDTGALLASLDLGRVDDTTVRAGSRDLDYSVYVEEGHEIVYVNADGEKVRTGRFVAPQPYMKPALYREREL